jgi:hypothetical protein
MQRTPLSKLLAVAAVLLLAAAAPAEFLGRSGHSRSEKLWTVAQAVSEVLPDGDKGKQLLQGLLNQRDGIEKAIREDRLF